jgi:hypothetical protein
MIPMPESQNGEVRSPCQYCFSSFFTIIEAFAASPSLPSSSFPWEQVTAVLAAADPIPILLLVEPIGKNHFRAVRQSLTIEHIRKTVASFPRSFLKQNSFS